MRFDRTCLWALAAAMVIASPMTAGAEGSGDASAQADRDSASGPARSEPTGGTLTGKERLSDKASDEQRVDNCKVPPDQRGPKPRPDSCDHGDSSMR